MKYIACTVLLSFVIWGLNAALGASLKAFGFPTYMIICAVSFGLILLLAYAWDCFERSRSQAVPRQLPSGSQSLEP